MKNHWQF